MALRYDIPWPLLSSQMREGNKIAKRNIWGRGWKNSVMLQNLRLELYSLPVNLYLWIAPVALGYKWFPHKSCLVRLCLMILKHASQPKNVRKSTNPNPVCFDLQLRWYTVYHDKLPNSVIALQAALSLFLHNHHIPSSIKEHTFWKDKTSKHLDQRETAAKEENEIPFVCRSRHNRS